MANSLREIVDCGSDKKRSVFISMQWSFGEQPAQPGVGKGVWYLINAPIEPSAVKTLRAARLIFRRGMLFCGRMLFCGLDFDVSRPYFRGRYTNFLSVTVFVSFLA